MRNEIFMTNVTMIQSCFQLFPSLVCKLNGSRKGVNHLFDIGSPVAYGIYLAALIKKCLGQRKYRFIAGKVLQSFSFPFSENISVSDIFFYLSTYALEPNFN